MAHNKGVIMEDQETLQLIRNYGGLFCEIGRLILNALMTHKVELASARKIWSSTDFADSIARLAQGTYKLVPRTDQEIIFDFQVGDATKCERVKIIRDQSFLEKIATNQRQSVPVRSAAFDRMVSNDKIARYATQGGNGKAILSRVKRTFDPEILDSIARGDDTWHEVVSAAMENLSKIEPARLVSIAITHKWVGRAKTAVNFLHDTGLVALVRDHAQTHEAVKTEAWHRLEKLTAL